MPATQRRRRSSRRRNSRHRSSRRKHRVRAYRGRDAQVGVAGMTTDTGVKRRPERRMSKEEFEQRVNSTNGTLKTQEDLSIFLHGFTNVTLDKFLEDEKNRVFQLISPHIQHFEQYNETPVYIDLSSNTSVIDFLRNYPCLDEDWWYIEDHDDILNDVKELLQAKGYTLQAARVRHFSKCSTPTANFHIDCPFGIDMNRIKTPAQRAVLQAANFTGFHNFIMTISEDPKCTTRYIDHQQFRYHTEEQLTVLNLHCKHQTVLNNPNSPVNYNQLCINYVNNGGALTPIGVNVLTNVVDYNFHRGPIPDDFKTESGNVDTERMNNPRTLVHFYCTRNDS